MRRAIATMVVALVAALVIPCMAQAATDVFSQDAEDWGGSIEIDASNKFKITIEGRLVPSVDYQTGLPLFSVNYTGLEPFWTSGFGTAMQNEKIDFVVQSILPPAVAELGMDCEPVEEGSGAKGDKFRCTQRAAAPLPAGVNASNIDLYAQYLFIWPFNGNTFPPPTVSSPRALGFPLNLGALIARGLSEEQEEEEEEEEETPECDVSETTGDCDGDGLLNGVDSCPSEYGEGEDGCPLSGDISGEGGVQPISDGGGCSTIAPTAAPNASAFLMIALALLPLAIRRRR